jgi:ATP adenylyltransferase
MPPSPDTLRLAFHILSSVSQALSTDILCFYNCGPVSGASQAHCHLQFVNLKSGGGVLVEELLSRIQKDGKEMGE